MKKIAILCLALVLALGSIGVAYAHWSQTLTITENVTTGKLCVGVRDVGTNDPPPALKEYFNAVQGLVHPTGTNPNAIPNETGTGGTGTEDPGYNKNVGSAISANGTFKCTHDGVDFFDSVKETIRNAYPSYSCNITLEFANCGTVPVKGNTFLTGQNLKDPQGLFQFIEIKSWKLTIPGDANSPYTGSGFTGLEARLKLIQLDPCKTMTLELEKHVKQTVIVEDGEDEWGDPIYVELLCPENATCEFSETIEFIQWNVTP